MEPHRCFSEGHASSAARFLHDVREAEAASDGGGCSSPAVSAMDVNYANLCGDAVVPGVFVCSL